jgi:hypothetical protein
MEDLLSNSKKREEGVASFLLEPFFFSFNKRVDIAKVRNERNVKQGSIVLRIEVEVE